MLICVVFKFALGTRLAEVVQRRAVGGEANHPLPANARVLVARGPHRLRREGCIREGFRELPKMRGP